MSSPVVVVGEDAEDLKLKLGDYIRDIIETAIRDRGHAFVAVSGGSMPKTVAPLFERISSVDWQKVCIFAADERMEHISNPESNTGAYISLLPEEFKESFLDVGDVENTAQCAERYANQLRKRNPELKDGWPMFDLLLLGHGPDGHTCSLFPGHSLLKNTTDWIAPIEDSPKPPPRRITLTLPVLNHARHVAFVSTGQGKADIIKSIVKDRNENLPAALVKPVDGTLHWFVDKGAASKL